MDQKTVSRWCGPFLLFGLALGCGSDVAPVNSFEHGGAEMVILVDLEGTAEQFIKSRRLLSGSNNLDAQILDTLEERGFIFLGYPDANYRTGVSGMFGMYVTLETPDPELVARIRAANPGLLLLEVLEDGESPRARIVGYSTVSGWPFGDGTVTELAFGS